MIPVIVILSGIIAGLTLGCKFPLFRVDKLELTLYAIRSLARHYSARRPR